MCRASGTWARKTGRAVITMSRTVGAGSRFESTTTPGCGQIRRVMVFMLIEAGSERFDVSSREQADGRAVYDFLWINGPEGYGFTFGKTPVPGTTQDRVERWELEREADVFVRSFFAEGGIGLTDFPGFVAARRSLLKADES